MEPPIYLDNNSTTPIDPAVLAAMLPYLTTHFGNPGNGSHAAGARAARAVERAREQVAAAVGAAPDEIVFTSGATESDNLAVLGTVRAAGGRGHVVTSAVEHKAVLNACRRLEHEGARVTVLPVDGTGRVDPADVRRTIRPDTLLVSVMAANNEVGSLQPVAEIGRVCREHGVLFHTDAAQALGRIPVDVDAWGADLLSLSGHKAYGPMGVGALYVRCGTAKALAPLLFGGGQEGGLRPGTVPVPGAVGLGAACVLAAELQPAEAVRLRLLREQLRGRLLAAVPRAVVHGHPTEHLPGLLSVSFLGTDSELLVSALPQVAASRGSACSAGASAPSHVLRALGVVDAVARSTVRFGLGRFTTNGEVDRAAVLIAGAVEALAGAAKPRRPGVRQPPGST